MTETERFFLQILSGYACGRMTEPPAEAVDWEQLLTLVREQSLCGVAWYQCRTFLQDQPELLEKLHAGFLSDVFYFTCQAEELGEISERFTRERIPFLPMKGAVLCNYHPIPQLRTKGDIDLLIHHEDRQRSHEIMLALGFQCTVDNPAVWTYTRDAVIFEIHDHMMYESLASSIDYCGYFDRVWDHASPVEGSARWEMDEDFHFLYLLTHTAKHIVNKGSGFRPFLDMAFFARQAGQRIDWQAVTAQLEQLALLDFTKTCFAFCQRWFGVSMPIASAGLDDSFYEEATRKAFRDGLFGLENEENQTAASAKAMRRFALPYWLAAFALTWSKLFPSYRDMRLIGWYSFVDGRPWLMPAAWLYRFYYCARHKLEHSKGLLVQPYTRRKSIEDRERLISSWGL